MTFVDGEPIDAIKLQKLQDDVNLNKSKILGLTGKLSESEAVDSIGPELRKGTSSNLDLKAGQKNERFISFPTPFTRVPVVVACAQYSEAEFHGAVNVYNIEVTGFNANCPLPSTGKPHTIKINYIAIAY